MTAAQWARVLTAGQRAAETSPALATRLIVANALRAMATEAATIAQETR